ncbi:MAG: hypothetical protein K6F68_07420 [Clostridiales bacterium]|nr:hypothetical protein [Clostridiales bacterium]
MDIKRYAVLALALIMTLTLLFTGCRNKEDPNDPGGNNAAETLAPVLVTDDPNQHAVSIPESGNWHAEALFSGQPIRDAIPLWARLLIATLAGNTAFEIDVEFSDDGTFTYETNTETLKKAASGSANTLLGFFVKDLDLSLFIDNALNAILPETAVGKNRDCYGTYERDEDGMLTVTTTDGTVLYFRAFGKKLVQFDENGELLLTFTRP